jgi:hypothetical protein
MIFRVHDCLTIYVVRLIDLYHVNVAVSSPRQKQKQVCSALILIAKVGEVGKSNRLVCICVPVHHCSIRVKYGKHEGRLTVPPCL